MNLFKLLNALESREISGEQELIPFAVFIRPRSAYAVNQYVVDLPCFVLFFHHYTEHSYISWSVGCNRRLYMQTELFLNIPFLLHDLNIFDLDVMRLCRCSRTVVGEVQTDN